MCKNLKLNFICLVFNLPEDLFLKINFICGLENIDKMLYNESGYKGEKYGSKSNWFNKTRLSGKQSGA